MTTVFFSRTAPERLTAIRTHLSENSYRPKAIRRTYIQKAGSKEMRPLGIPAVSDRIVQGAVKLVIEPIFEHTFAPGSYGFRPGRGCKDALTQVQRLLNAGYHHIVDVDIKGYFDAIPHDLLILPHRRSTWRRVPRLPDVFCVRWRHHFLFFREHADHIAVISILHENMDIPVRLREDAEKTP